VERLQCYRGVSEEQAIGRFDESLQRLYMEYAKGQHGSCVLVQREMENWRSPLASIPPSSAGQLGEHRAT
jgi:hypothetical protein